MEQSPVGAVVRRPGLAKKVNPERRRSTFDYHNIGEDRREDFLHKEVYSRGAAFVRASSKTNSVMPRTAAAYSSGSRAAAAAAHALVQGHPQDESPPQPKPADRQGTLNELARLLARSHRLEQYEVRSILSYFDAAPRSESGGIEEQAFKEVLCKIFDIPDIKTDILQSAYVASDCKRKVDIEKFLSWYVQNMFTDVTKLRGDVRNVSSNELLYEVSRRHGVSVNLLDRVKRQFDKYDLDHSGIIDYSEFKNMIQIIMKVTEHSDISEARMKAFWNQVVPNSSKGIGFEEFVVWYLQNFYSGDDEFDGFSSTDMAEVFYNSLNPTVLRRNSHATISRRHTME